MANRFLLLTFLSFTSASQHLPILARDYVDTVCKPLTKNPGDTIPPCIELETIETLCLPNGTEPIHFAATQQCMCNGSFFREWPGCLACLYEHGLRSERDTAQYVSILDAVSSAFCDPASTPTAVFAEYFTSFQNSVPWPTTGATEKSDRALGKTEVSLYYTLSGSQGPGAITGAAATATRTGGAPVPTGSTAGADATDATTTTNGNSQTRTTMKGTNTAAPNSPSASHSSSSTSSSGNAGARATGLPSVGDALLWGAAVGAAMVL